MMWYHRSMLLLCLLPAAMGAGVSPGLRQDGANLYASLKTPALMKAGLEQEMREWVAAAFAGCPATDWILTDLRRLNVSSRLVENAAGKRAEWLVEFDGVWDWPSVRECLAAQGYWLEEHRGTPMMVPSEQHKSGAAAAHYNGEYLYVGSAETVRAALDRLADGATGDDSLAAKAADLDAKYDCWVAGLGSPMDYAKHTSKETRNLVPAPRQYWLGLTSGNSYSLDLSIQMMSPEEAALVLRLLSALPTLTKLSSAERGIQSELYRFHELGQAGDTVRIKATVPGFALWQGVRALTSSGKAARFGRIGSRNEQDRSSQR